MLHVQQLRMPVAMVLVIALLVQSTLRPEWALARPDLAGPANADPVATQHDPNTGETIEVFEDGTIKTTAKDGSVVITPPQAQAIRYPQIRREHAE